MKVIPAVANWTENYFDMWRKSIVMWKTVASTLLLDYDYFLAGGDDLYVIVENLRELLSSSVVRKLTRNGKDPIYLGRKLNQNKYISFHCGGPGYVLNRAAVVVLNNVLNDARQLCLPDFQTSVEDVLVAFCLKQAGILPTDIFDEEGQNLFHPLSPGASYAGRSWGWYKKMANNFQVGVQCCSNRSVSFHNIKPASYMRAFHRVVYHRDQVGGL